MDPHKPKKVPQAPYFYVVGDTTVATDTAIKLAERILSYDPQLSPGGIWQTIVRGVREECGEPREIAIARQQVARTIPTEKKLHWDWSPSEGYKLGPIN